MAHLGISIETRMSQSLVMTPRLQQAIKLLQYNTLEMVQHVQEAMLENPTLEVVPDSDGAEPEAPADLVQKANDTENDLLEQRNGTAQNTVDWEKLIEHMNGRTRINRTSGGKIHY